MNWQTKEQVQAAAAGSTLDALICSMEHHKQGAECGYEEAVARRTSDAGNHVRCSFCALCNRFSDMADGSRPACGKCPLRDCSLRDLWCDIKDAWADFNTDRSRANFDAFQSAERKMVAKLDELIAEEKGKCCKCDKAERIRVPEGIRFAVKYGEQASYGLVFNNGKQVLTYDYPDKEWFVCTESHFTGSVGELYLEPCKREDLKAGGWAVGRNCDSTGYAADERFYHLILDVKRYIFIGDSGIPEIEDDTLTYWWKVVQ